MAQASPIMLFVEDPGAANFVAPLPQALARRNVAARLCASDTGATQLDRLGIDHERIDHRDDPDRLLDRLAASALVVGSTENPNGLGPALTAAARRRSIPTAGVVDGPANAQLRFRSDRGEAGVPEHILVPDASTGKSLAASGIAPGRISVCGHPHFDAVRAARLALDGEGRDAVRRRLFPRLADGRRLIVFAAERSDGLVSAEFRRASDYTLQGRGVADGRTEIVLEEVLEGLARLPERPHLVVRLHPKSSRDEYASYFSEIDEISDRGTALDVAYAADAVVGMTSILLVEAALLGRPTLSVIPRPCERDWLATAGSGLSLVATRRDEVAAALGEVLAVLPPRPEELDVQFPPGAVDRAAAAIVAICAPLAGVAH